MKILTIETTCDETAAAIVAVGEEGRGEIRSNEVLSQIAEHAAYGGVVPEIAARAHVEVIDRLVARALKTAGATVHGVLEVGVGRDGDLTGRLPAVRTRARRWARARATSSVSARAVTSSAPASIWG